ncbi:C39 family peptidase [Senegalimassilia anaerobia]|uniref:C39 family peptidase n=1 Tax=Senegalimassilia anaerobia TaxID=1473216 RepID=UPI003A9829B8
MMREPIDTHFDKRETPQGRHARTASRSGRHARMATGASSWSVRRRSLVAAIAVAMAALMIVGVLAAHGRAGASGDGDQIAAQEALEAQTLETAYAADDSTETQQDQQSQDAEVAESVAPGMRPDDADGFSRNRRDALGAMGQETMGGFGRANVTQMAGFTGLSGTSANVPELFQYPSMPAGCEIYSLTVVLQAMGHDADPDSIVANQLPFDVEGDDYASAFWGDPYWSGEGMPPAIMAAGNAFLGEAGASECFANITGTDFDELASKASSGTPVLVWTTLDFEDPCFDEPLEANSFYDLEHCVVLLGVEGHRACIMDPTQGYVTVNYDWFKYLYEQCGSMALAIA